MSTLIDPRTLRARRLLTCIGLAAAPILVALSFALSPDTGDTAAEEIAGIADERGMFQLSAALGVIGFGMFVLGSSAVAQLARARGAAWVTTGAAMMAIGGFAMGAAFWSYGTAGYLLTGSSVDPDTAAPILDSGDDSAFVGIGWMLGMAVLVSLLVVGIGLLRAGTVPRWLAILTLVSPFVAFFGEEGVVGLLTLVPMIVACVLLAAEVLKLPYADTASDGSSEVPGQRTISLESDQPTTV